MDYQRTGRPQLKLRDAGAPCLTPEKSGFEEFLAIVEGAESIQDGSIFTLLSLSIQNFLFLCVQGLEIVQLLRR